MRKETHATSFCAPPRGPHVLPALITVLALFHARTRKNCASLPTLLPALTAAPARGKPCGFQSSAMSLDARRGCVCRPQAPSR
jgi:hypothetical protein